MKKGVNVPIDSATQYDRKGGLDVTLAWKCLNANISCCLAGS